MKMTPNGMMFAFDEMESIEELSEETAMFMNIEMQKLKSMGVPEEDALSTIATMIQVMKTFAATYARLIDEGKITEGDRFKSAGSNKAFNTATGDEEIIDDDDPTT